MRRGRLVRLAVLAAIGLVMAWLVLGAALAYQRRGLCDEANELGASASRAAAARPYDDGRAALTAAKAESARRDCAAIPLV